VGSPSRWSRFVDSAVRTPGAGESTRHPARAEAPARADAKVRRAPAGETVRRVVSEKVRGRPKTPTAADGPRRRTDVRLAPAALLVWCAAITGAWLTPSALLALCCGLVLVAGVLLGKAVRRAVSRTFLTTAAIAVLLAVSTAAHSAVSSSQRTDGPFAKAVRDGKSVVAILDVTETPRAVSPAGQTGTAARWTVPATAVEVTTGGQMLRSRTEIVVMGGSDWGAVAAGQRIRTTGKLRPADPGQTEAAILAASTAPVPLSGGGVGWQVMAADLRDSYVAASSFLAPDPGGLLPGMVTGDTSALDEGLNAAMQAVGMTHLTAVSGATT
jgi:competence protein ComEC